MRLTQANSESLIKAKYPKATVKTVSGLDGSRDYMVYLQGAQAGEMYTAYGNTKRQAWRAAAEALRQRGEI